MYKQNKWLILGILALCASVCYIVGFVGGTIAFVAIAVIFELAFWVGIFLKLQKQKKGMPTEFHCFYCKSTINKDDKKCPSCGWTWKTQENIV